jgi:hypothetical protein
LGDKDELLDSPPISGGADIRPSPMQPLKRKPIVHLDTMDHTGAELLGLHLFLCGSGGPSSGGGHRGLMSAIA